MNSAQPGPGWPQTTLQTVMDWAEKGVAPAMLNTTGKDIGKQHLSLAAAAFVVGRLGGLDWIVCLIVDLWIRGCITLMHLHKFPVY